jgi:hypothetical protein
VASKYLIAGLATLIFFPFFSNNLYAERAKLIVKKSKYVSPNKPKWYVSSQVKADIEEQHIDGGTGKNQTVRNGVQNDVGCSINDDAGHYIANSLGGIGRKYYNIYPENRTLNRGKQRVWEGKVKEYVMNDCDKARVTVRVKFNDNSSPSTRPVTVKYLTRCVGTVQPGAKKKLKTQNWTNNKPAGC